MSQSKTSSHLIGGFFGGLASSVTLQPFDLVKTRLQQQPNSTFKQVFHELNGISQLWRGTAPSALRTSVGSALYLSSLNIFRSSLAKAKPTTNSVSSSTLPKLSMTENLVTGSFTRGVVGFITMPITVIKVRYESTFYKYTSLWEAVRSISTTEGFRGFFNGFTATAARDTPYAGLYVLLYEQMKELLPSLIKSGTDSKLLNNNDTQLFNTSTSAVINSISAFSAASLATTITAPFDTIKTRMQLQPQKFSRFTGTFISIIKNESFLNLFDGLSLRLTRKAFSAGIAWGIYEEIVKFVVKKKDH